MVGMIKTEVLLATGNDDRFPPSNMVDGNEKTFWITTGMYPHEVLIGFNGAAANLTRINTATHHIKKLIIEKSTDLQPTTFDRIVDTELKEKGGAFQMESFQISSQAGQGVRFLKLVIGSGYEEFSSVHNVVVEGELLSS
eukprot:RCo022608